MGLEAQSLSFGLGGKIHHTDILSVSFPIRRRLVYAGRMEMVKVNRASLLAWAVAGALAIAWSACDSGGDSAGTGAAGPGGTGGATGTTTSASGGGATPMFETDIVPIFNTSCGAADNACHSEVAYAADSNSACRGWLALKDAPLGSQIYGGPNDGQPTGCPDLPLYERLVQLDAWQECNGSAKRYIVPCDVDASYLFDKIDDGPYCGGTPDAPSEPMPKGKLMDPGEKETIRAWILAGAPRVDGTKVDCNPSTTSTGTVNPGSSPQAQISHPGDMETRPANVAIPFIGSATDAEDGTLQGASLVWMSDVTGEIGTGLTFDAPLPAGTHVITLSATDSDGNVGTDSITLFIQ